jgi:hypothetical protein
MGLLYGVQLTSHYIDAILVVGAGHRLVLAVLAILAAEGYCRFQNSHHDLCKSLKAMLVSSQVLNNDQLSLMRNGVRPAMCEGREGRGRKRETGNEKRETS